MIVHQEHSWSEDAVLPAAVMIACSPTGQSAVNGVVVGKRFAVDQRDSVCMRTGEDGSTLHLWRGFRLSLRRSQAEDYYLNLRADDPSVFVIGRHGDNGFVPERLTVSLDEAQNLDATELRDSREMVRRAPMPPEIYRWMEAFVLKYYEPRRKGGKGRGKRRSRAMYDAEVGDYADGGEAS